MVFVGKGHGGGVRGCGEGVEEIREGLDGIVEASGDLTMAVKMPACTCLNGYARKL